MERPVRSKEKNFPGGLFSMQRNWWIRAVVLIALSLSFPWAAQGQGGKVYRYTAELADGSNPGDELLFVSGSRVEVLTKAKSDGEGRRPRR
jgi:hypothetical protein